MTQIAYMHVCTITYIIRMYYCRLLLSTNTNHFTYFGQCEDF